MTVPVLASYAPISFAVAIPSGSESTEHQVEVASLTDVTVAVAPTTGFFSGILVDIPSLGGAVNVIVRVYDGDPTGTGLLIYEATYAFTAAILTLSEMLGSEQIPFQNGCWVTLQGDAVVAASTVYAYLNAGTVIKKLP